MSIEITIERLGINGEGIGRHNGCTVFIDGALPGDRVLATITERRKNFSRASLKSLLSRASSRIDPICPLFGLCGGCQIMHLEYSEQCNYKRQKVADALERIGKFKNVNILPCVPSPNPLFYRNKIQLPVSQSSKKVSLGLYAQSTHDVIPLEKCYIHSRLGEKVLNCLQGYLSTSSLTPYSQNESTGELMSVMIKTALFTNEALIVFVTSTDCKEKLSEIAQLLMLDCPEVKGVLQNIKTTVSNTFLGRDMSLVLGASSIQELLCGLFFKVSPHSFFQVNPAQAENLYRKVVELAVLEGDETVLDAYCGVGTLSLILAKHVKKVIGVECVKEAVQDAIENSALNGISNVEFHCALAENFIQTLENVDVVIINPPRKGCERVFLESVVRLKPGRLIYVSCDPATLARDLQFLCENEYAIDFVQPFDMFPQTAHVETIVRLKRP